jgi:ribosomal protein S18 acetylase RimI-like enzyme
MGAELTEAILDIRPFRSEDEDPVVALWERCGLTRPWNDPRKDIARKMTVQPELFLVGTIDGQVVATVMAGYEGHRGWINYLGVDPDHQRRGHARALMQSVEARLRALECPKINLQVRAGNVEAMGFYATLGYVRDDVVSLGHRLVDDER